MKKLIAIAGIILLTGFGTVFAAETIPVGSEGKGSAVSDAKTAPTLKGDGKQDGAKLFVSKGCIACHGKDAGGIKGLAPSLKDSKFVKTAKEEEVRTTIREGRAGAKKLYKDIPTAMPVNKLTDDEATALVKHLKGLGEKDAKPKVAEKKTRKAVEGC